MTVKRLRNICVVLILISVHVQCIQVHEDAKENITTILPMLSDSQEENHKNNESMEVGNNNMMKAISSDDKDNHAVEAITTAHRIPPTLTNTNTDYIRLSPIKQDKSQQDTKPE